MTATLRMLFMLVLIGVWALAVPLAMASGACMAMGGTCEGPCGVSSGAVPLPTAGPVLAVVAFIVAHPPDRAVAAPLRLPELPPRPQPHAA